MKTKADPEECKWYPFAILVWNLLHMFCWLTFLKFEKTKRKTFNFVHHFSLFLSTCLHITQKLQCLWFALTTASPNASIMDDLFISLWSRTNYTVVSMAVYCVTFINPKCIQQDNLSYTTIMSYNSPAMCIRLYEKPSNDVSPARPGFLRLEKFITSRSCLL